ncbi:MAG: hypothetical protein ACRELY_07165, partial [Polyangiaceae bacterium]
MSALLGLVACASVSSSTWAAPPAGKDAAAKKKEAAPTAQLSPGLKEKLKGSDQAAIQGALDEIRTAGHAAAPLANDVAGLLDRGTTLQLTVAAIDALG